MHHSQLGTGPSTAEDIVVETRRWQLTAIQCCSAATPAENIAMLDVLFAQLPMQRPQLVVLPEAVLCFDAGFNAQLPLAEVRGQGPWQQACAELAKRYGIWLLVGSFPLKSSDPAKFSASSLLFDDQGVLQADYQKIHLFDADVADNTASYRESDTTMPGTKLGLATLCDHTQSTAQDCRVSAPDLQLGMAICYDMRFAGLFQAYQRAGAQVIAVPSAFTTVTGAAHWYPLLQARAIETQCYIVAPAQTGQHANGRQTFGHSVIIDPWGQVIADAGTLPGMISVTMDGDFLQQVRQRMPVARHNRFISELL
jgi:predicted amidohydrolase